MKGPDRFVDLHLHTSASDGLTSPEEMVELAKEKNLAAIAITDHDSLEGFKQALPIAEEIGIEIVPGVELSCFYQGEDLHILGYLIDYENPEFNRELAHLQQGRFERGKRMVQKLNDLGINLSVEAVVDIAGEGSVGRPHIAEALVKEEFVPTYREAFTRYLGYHAPAYVPKKFMNPEEGINLIHSNGGVAILAHPGTNHRDDLIPELVSIGLDGLEAYHHSYAHHTTIKYINMAKKFGLIYTGGSDCHGARGGRILIGCNKVPYVCLENLRRVKEEMQSKQLRGEADKR
jgi:predicted metal-dependent phosphoesterase TrpH